MITNVILIAVPRSILLFFHQVDDMQARFPLPDKSILTWFNHTAPAFRDERSQALTSWYFFKYVNAFVSELFWNVSKTVLRRINFFLGWLLHLFRSLLSNYVESFLFDLDSIFADVSCPLIMIWQALGYFSDSRLSPVGVASEFLDPRRASRRRKPSCSRECRSGHGHR
jgi:hypothetical protein